MPARASWQELLKKRSQSSEEVRSVNPQPSISKPQPSIVAPKTTSLTLQPQPSIVAPKTTSLTLHALLKSANPCWSSAEFKTAKKKLKTIGIESYSDLEEVLLQGQGILNNRLREHGWKAFAASTLDRLNDAVLAEHERIKKAAEQEEAAREASAPKVTAARKTEQDKLRKAVQNDSWEQIGIVLQQLSEANGIEWNKSTHGKTTRGKQEPSVDAPISQQPSSTNNKTLFTLLKTANPGWTAKDLDAAMKKLKIIGIVTYLELEEVVLQGKGILNKRLKDHGLKIFAPSTLQRLKNAVKVETPRQTPLAPPMLTPISIQTPRSIQSQRSSPQRFSFSIGSPSDTEAETLDMSMTSEKDFYQDSDIDSVDWYADECVDDCMRWYEDSDSDVTCKPAEPKLPARSSRACRIKIAPLDLSKAVRMPEFQLSGRSESTTVSTTVGTSPPSSPKCLERAMPVSFFSIGTP